MARPVTIEIAGKRWRIRYGCRRSEKGYTDWGQCDYDDREIRIKSSLKNHPHLLANTSIHETTHAVIQELKLTLDDEEAFCDELAAALMNALTKLGLLIEDTDGTDEN